MLYFVASQVKDFQLWELYMKINGKRVQIIHKTYLQDSKKPLEFRLALITSSSQLLLSLR